MYMVFNGLLRQVQVRGDLFIGKAARNHREEFLLTAREPGRRSPDARTESSHARNNFEQGLTKLRRTDSLAPRDRANCGNYVCCRGFV